MKKILLVASLLSTSHFAFADTCYGLATANMYVKNDSASDVVFYCALNSSPYTAKSGLVTLIQATAGGSCMNLVTYPSVPPITCQYYTDTTKSHLLGSLTMNFSCSLTGSSQQLQQVTLNTSSSPVPTPFACAATKHNQGPNGPSSQGCAGMPSFDGTGYFTLPYPIINYTILWSGITTNLTKGQTMANKLANSLRQSNSYTNMTSQYDGSTLKITFTTPAEIDPYTGIATSDSITKCQQAQG